MDKTQTTTKKAEQYMNHTKIWMNERKVMLSNEENVKTKRKKKRSTEERTTVKADLMK